MILWPAELPQRSMTDAFNEALGDGRLRTPMEAGPPKVRRRFSTAVRPVQTKLFLTLNEKARLDRFWCEDTKGGSLPFLLPDQVYDGATLLDANGNAITCPDGNSMLVDGNVIPETLGGVITITAWWLVMFGDQPPAYATPSYGEIWTASFSVSVMP